MSSDETAVGAVLAVADRNGWWLLGAFAVGFAALPVTVLPEGFYTSEVTRGFMFAILALSWAIIGGQTGYPSFGQMAFFGVGAYTTAILVKTFGVAFPPALLAAGALSLVAAAVVGAVVLRLRGGYFAIATLGVLLVAQQVTRNHEITNGPDGIILFDTPDIVPGVDLGSGAEFYYLYLGLLVAEMALVYYLMDTRFGYLLNAVRDDEAKATAMGVNTPVYKTAAWMIGALFTGLAGGAFGLFNTFVDPATGYNLAWNVELIAMALLGGAGSVAGPVFGAFFLHAVVVIVDTLATGFQLILVGGVVIATIVLLPEGAVGWLRERASAMEYYRYAGGAAGESSGEAADGGEP